MGYDCTLHAVDEELISKDFVKALLGGTVPTKGPVADAKLDEGFWKSVFEGFEKEKPSGAASLICQLALVFASKSLPYHYERGFAISLWPELTEGLATEFPEELTESPEMLFKELVKTRPELKGSFPNDFDGNWTTGRFIPATKVPEALAWVETRLQKYDEGDRDLFRGLILVLKHCAKHKLAYWEATDLPVPMAKIEAEGSEARRAERCFKWPDHGYVPLASAGNLYVCKHRIGPGPNSKTALADFSSWPPSISWLPEHSIDAAISSAGQLLTVAYDTRIERIEYQVRIRDSKTPENEPVVLRPRINTQLPPSGVYKATFYENEAVALLWFEKGVSAGRYPLFQANDELLEDRSFRRTRDKDEHWGDEKIAFGTAKIGDGTSVFIWGKRGYLRKDGKWEETYRLIEDHDYYDWSSVPADADSFYFISNSQLYEVKPNEEPSLHLQKLTNIMHLRAGPDGSLLLKEGDNKAGDWGKLYWPKERLLTSLKPELLPDLGRRDLCALYWLEAKHQLFAFAPEEVWFIPWDELKNLPRTTVRS